MNPYRPVKTLETGDLLIVYFEPKGTWNTGKTIIDFSRHSYDKDRLYICPYSSGLAETWKKGGLIYNERLQRIE